MRFKKFLTFSLMLFAQITTGAGIGNHPSARQADGLLPSICPLDREENDTLLPRWLYAFRKNNPDMRTIGMLEEDEKKCSPDALHNMRFFAEDQAAQKVKALSKTVKCMLTQSMTRRLKTAGQDAFLLSLQEKIPFIRALLPTLFPPKLLLPLLSNPDFSIRLCFSPVHNGIYTAEPNVVWLFIKPYWTDEDLQSVLKNELHHALVAHHNVQVMHGSRLPQTP